MLYELEVCETTDKQFSWTQSPTKFHVELRLIEAEGGSALVLAGPVRATRDGAELDMEMIPFTPTKREIDKKTKAERSVPQPLPGVIP